MTELVTSEEMTEAEKQDIWDCVFLTKEERTELLSYVEAHPHYPFTQWWAADSIVRPNPASD